MATSSTTAATTTSTTQQISEGAADSSRSLSSEKTAYSKAFTAAYEYLRVFRGPLSSVHQVETTLSYALPDLGKVGVELKYVNGRDPDTLQKQERIMLGFGVKY